MAEKLSVFNYVWHCGEMVDGTEDADEYGWWQDFKADCGKVILVGGDELDDPITNHRTDNYKAYHLPGKYCKKCYGDVAEIRRPIKRQKPSRIDLILSKYKKEYPNG